MAKIQLSEKENNNKTGFFLREMIKKRTFVCKMV